MKVALLGTAPGWEQALDLDQTWELWGLNEGYLRDPALLTRCSRWFELHGYTPLTKARRRPEHWGKLATFAGPVYTLFQLPGIPNAVRFPIEAVAAIRDYFACTFAYQIGLALSEGVTEYGLYGTPLTGAREALVERPCVEWWNGYAEGRGVKVTIVHESDVGLGRQPYRYAFNDQAERYLAYKFAYEHHEDVEEWIHYEEMRLRVTRPWWEKPMRRIVRTSYAKKVRAATQKTGEY